jgi:hypothetical protein
MKKILVACVPFIFLVCSCALESGNVIGPAGGFVFYDKGYYSNGWRYLEASPKDAGNAEWGKAVQLCAEFSYGGYTDWFLPSIGELEKMVKTSEHLFEVERGYWSSTSDSYLNAYGGYRANSKFYSRTYNKGNSYAVRPVRRF